MLMPWILCFCGLCQAVRTTEKGKADALQISEIYSGGEQVSLAQFNASSYDINKSALSLGFNGLDQRPSLERGPSRLTQAGARMMTPTQPSVTTSAPVASVTSSAPSIAANTAQLQALLAAPPIGDDRTESLKDILRDVKPYFDRVRARNVVDIDDAGLVTLKLLTDNTLPFQDHKPNGASLNADARSVVKRESVDDVAKTLEDLNDLLAIVGIDTLTITGFSALRDDGRTALINNRNQWVQNKLSPVLADSSGTVTLLAGSTYEKKSIISVKTVLDVSILKAMKPPLDEEGRPRSPLNRDFAFLKSRMKDAEAIVHKVKGLLADSGQYVKFTQAGGSNRVNVELPRIHSNIPFISYQGKPDEVFFAILDLIKDDGSQFIDVNKGEVDEVKTSLQKLAQILKHTGVDDMSVTGQSLIGPRPAMRAMIAMSRATNVVKFLLRGGADLSNILASEAVELFRDWCTSKVDKAVENMNQTTRGWLLDNPKQPQDSRSGAFISEFWKQPLIFQSLASRVKGERWRVSPTEYLASEERFLFPGLARYTEPDTFPIKIDLLERMLGDFKVRISVRPLMSSEMLS